MMNREDLKVGNEYVWIENEKTKRKIIAIGKEKVFYEICYEGRSEGEYIQNIHSFLSNHKPIPKEPRKLGRLYAIRKEFEEGSVYLLKVLSWNAKIDKDNIPVTIDSEGNVFEVLEGE